LDVALEWHEFTARVSPEGRRLLSALLATAGNIREAARLLNQAESTLRSRLARLKAEFGAGGEKVA
jgi:hypothetical protein